MLMKRTAFALLALSLSAAHAHNDDSHDKYKVTTSKVQDNIFLIEGDGGNIGLFIGDDGTFLIDDKFSPMSENILAEIKKVGGDIPKYLINTHFHGDHVEGNEFFGKKGSIIVSHDSVRGRLKEGYEVKEFNMKTGPAAPAALPQITFANSMHLHINGDDINAIHVPNAHTDGDIIIHFKNANVIHAGDVFGNTFFPFVDVSNGGTVRGVINAAETILSLSDEKTKIIPGHGSVSGIKELKEYRDMMVGVETILTDLKKQKLTAEQVIKMKPLAKYDSRWGSFISTDKWIEIIYPSI